MDRNEASGNAWQARRTGLLLNQVQLGLALGFVAVALLIVFGVGVLVGMWYQASSHITPYAETEGRSQDKMAQGQGPETLDELSSGAPGETPNSGGGETLMTFYQTLPDSEANADETAIVPQMPEASGPQAGPSQEVSPQKTSPEGAQGNKASGNASAAAVPRQKASPPRESMIYSVQVGSFRTVATAESLRARLAQKGYSARVRLSRVPGRGQWYRVRIGSFSKRADAELTATRLRTREKVPAKVTVELRQ